MLEYLSGAQRRRSMKWQKYQHQDVLPLWVADMDIACPRPVQQALQQACIHGDLGYHKPWPSLNEALIGFLQRQHGLDIQPQQIHWQAGVISGFSQACQAFSQPGDYIAVATPNYPPLLNAPTMAGRETLLIPTVQAKGQWQLDQQALSLALSHPRCTMLLLCNPMNPCGSVLSKVELDNIVQLCQQHQVLLLADEIHADLVHNPAFKHRSCAHYFNQYPHILCLMAASKSFNIAGLSTSFALAGDPSLIRRLEAAHAGMASHANYLGLVAAEAAFACDDWLAELKLQLQRNAEQITHWLAKQTTIAGLAPQATCLYWLDCRAIGNAHRYFERHGLGLSRGEDFGQPGWLRLNFGCSPDLLQQALIRLQQALDALP